MSASPAIAFYINPRYNWNVGYAMALGASLAASRNDRRLVIVEQIEALDPLPLAGLILFDMEKGEADIPLEMRKRHVPVVAVGRPIDSLPDVPAIFVDNRLGCRRITEALLAMGHTRIAFLGGVEDNWENVLRLAGARDALEAAGIGLAKRWTFHAGDWETQSAVSWGERIARECPGLTALICANDRMAQGAIMGIRRVGLRVPEDISVTGFDNFAFRNNFDPEFSDPPLTTMAYPCFEIGYQAFERLLQEIAEPGRSETLVHIPPAPVFRKSAISIGDAGSAAPPASDYVISQPLLRALAGRNPGQMSIAELATEILSLALATKDPLESLSANFREAIYRGLEDVFAAHLHRKFSTVLKGITSHPEDAARRRRVALECVAEVIAEASIWHYRDFHSALQSRINDALSTWHRDLAKITGFDDAVGVADGIRRGLRIDAIQIDGRHLDDGGVRLALTSEPMRRRPDSSLSNSGQDSLVFHPDFRPGAILRTALDLGEAGSAILELEFDEARGSDFNRFAQALESLLLNASLNRRLLDRARELELRNDDLVQAKAAADEARAVAEQAAKVKSEFLANMSHEIRTPMNGILGVTEIALDTELTAQQFEYLNLIKASTFSLLTIINDILDFSKMESGRFQLEEIPFSLRDTFDDAIRALAIQAGERHLELIYDIRPDVPDCLVGDPGRLRQILNNLVGNALKFTPEGEVMVRVSRQQGDESDLCQLHLEVRDTGIGIPSEKLNVIFESFSQADNSTARVYGGTGLGLAISARLVDQMQGRIWVESEIGVGSAFHVSAPFAISKHTVTRHQTIDPTALNGYTALVIDDNAINREIFRETLEGWGVDVKLASGPREGLALLRTAKKERPFDILLLDVVMPEMDGFQVARRIREDHLCEQTHLIMLSSAFRGEDVNPTELGCKFFLTKPTLRSELLRAIYDSLNLPPQTIPAPARTPERASQCMRILLAEDNHVSALVAERLLTQRGHSVVVAANGLQAIELWRQGGFDLILMDMHMPELDGDAAAREIRRLENGQNRRIPIVAQTANAMSEAERICLEAGMDAYITKPIVRDKFITVVESFAPPGNGQNKPS